MNQPRVARFSVFAGALALLATSAASAAPPSEGLRAVRLAPSDAEAAARVGITPSFVADYGSFRWLELSSGEIERLRAAGVSFLEDADAGTVQVVRYRFDPLREGEPKLGGGEVADGSVAGFRLIQFRGPVKDEWLRELAATGLPALQYYPFNTYLTWASAGRAESAEVLPFVRWQGPVHPAYKVAPELDGRTGLIRNVDLMFYDDGDLAGAIARLEGLGAKVLQSYPSQPDRKFYDVIAELPASALPAASRLPSVLFLGYQGPRPVLDDEMSDQILAGNHPGGTPVTGYNAHLGTLGVNGTGVVWAVIDTGVDYDHPDLGPHIVGGYEFPGSCGVPGQPGSDCAAGGHGTHVSGIVGGTAAAGYTDASGFLYGLGVAPSVSFFAMNSLSASAWPPVGGWQEHSKQAVLGTAIGGNNSWTTGEGTNHGYQASERTHDLMVRDGNFDTAAVAEPFIEVFSAGNSGPSGSTLTAPKEAKNLIVTAASRNFRVGSIDAIASFSSRGPAVDGRIVPTITAPGEEISSARNDTGGSCTGAGYDIAGTGSPATYSMCSGTSMASPHVSGVVALAAQWWRTFNAGANPSPAMAKALLVNSAVDMGTADIPNFNEGWGRVNVSTLVQPGVARVYKEQDAARTFGATGETHELVIGIADLSKPFKVTVAWSDAPGAAGANPALVNNLDLEVVFGATTYKGNVFTAGWSATGGIADVKNNLENVYLAVPPAGSATIRVKATNIAGDGVPYNADTTDQDFALVCTNCVEQPDFTLGSTPLSQSICAPADGTFTVEVGSILGYVSPVTLGLTGNPAGTTTGFSVNPVTPAVPAAASTLTIGNTGAAAAGDYALTLTGTASGPNVKNLPLGLSVFTAPPAAPTLTAPADGSVSVPLRPTFQWGAVAQAASYRLQVSTSPGFGSFVLDAPGLTGTSFTPTTDLPSNTVLYWRVIATNACGTGTESATFDFATVALPGDCGIGTTPRQLYFESFDGTVTGWTSAGTGDTWAISTTRSHSAPSSYKAVDPATSSDQQLTSPSVALPNAASLTLQFWNHQTMEHRSAGGCWDGGLLEVSTDGGTVWNQIPTASMLTDPYDGALGSGNPLAPRDAWCGDPQEWLNSVVDLTAYAGQSVRFRFRMSSDGSVSREGWYLDDVKVLACLAAIHIDGFETGDLSSWHAHQP